MEIVKFLIAQDAEVDVKANDGLTPLDYAYNYGSFINYNLINYMQLGLRRIICFSLLKMILKCIPSISIFHFSGNKEIIGYLLSNGAKGDNLSPLQSAAREGNDWLISY